MLFITSFFLWRDDLERLWDCFDNSNCISDSLFIINLNTPYKKGGFKEYLIDSTVWLNQLSIQWVLILISFFVVYYFIILEHRSTEMFVRVSLATAIASQTCSWRKFQFTVGIRKRPKRKNLEFGQRRKHLLYVCEIRILIYCYSLFIGAGAVDAKSLWLTDLQTF